MRKKVILFLAFQIFIILPLLSQVKISGEVFDSATKEPLVGANVFVPELNIGTTTDFEGKFVLKINNVENVNLRISYVGYRSIDTLIKVSGKDVKLKFLMKPEAVKFSEVEVSGTVKRDNVTLRSFIATKQVSTGIFDGLSYEQIKLTVASTSSDLMNKIVGVSVKQNKFVNVRGVDERYNITVLNGSLLPSPEPDRKAFTFDLIPSSVVQSIKVIKTFSPELPGNFSGGFIDIKTIEFSDTLTNSADLGVSAIPDATFKKFFVYGMDRVNIFGVSNKTTGLPSNFPDDITKVPVSERSIYAREIKNLWVMNSFNQMPNFKGGFMSAGKIPLVGLNYSLSLIYKGNVNSRKFEVNEYEGDYSKRFEYGGDRVSRDVQFSFLADVKKKFGGNVLGFRGLIIGITNEETAKMQGYQYTDQGAEQIHMAINFNQRNLYFTQLYGEHEIKDVLLKWQGSTSTIFNKEPDTRRLVYGRDMNDPDAKFAVILGPQANFKNGGILTSDLKDNVREFKTSVKFPIFGANFETGFNFWETKRDFKFRLIGVVVNLNGITDYRMYYLPPDSIFIPDNFKRNGFSLDEYKAGTNKYKAYDRSTATYLKVDLPIRFGTQVLTIMGGARIEKVNQNIYTRDFSDSKDLVISKKYLDVLPALELKYSPLYMVNLKASYSQTINKPELREISPFAYFDFYTQTSIRGDSTLIRAISFNYDFRFEVFSLGEDMISVGLFHKHISKPIEKVIVSGSALGSERTYKNANFAKVTGVEIEFVKNLKLVKAIGNMTFVDSKVDVEGTEGTIARKGRRLQGQAPYIANIQLVYDKPSSKFNASISYNLTGPKIFDVATQYNDDIIEQARYQVDFKIGYNLTKNLSIVLTGQNITGKPVVLKQAGYLYQKVETIRSISLDVKVKF
jgi:hypothetical protein